jgi:hypothetical protein
LVFCKKLYQKKVLDANYWSLIFSIHQIFAKFLDCNSREKGDKAFCILTHNHPYLDSFDKRYLFRIDTKSITENNILEISLDYLDKSRIDFTNRETNILKRYSGKNLKDAINLKNQYLDYKHYLDDPELADTFKKLLFANIWINWCEILKKINGKMNRDIIKQLYTHNIIKDYALNLL